VVEHVTFNHGVEGSSPSALTKTSNEIRAYLNFSSGPVAPYLGRTTRTPLIVSCVGCLQCKRRG
jgi:hypothetical protein